MSSGKKHAAHSPRANETSRPVQISIDPALLRQIDGDEETKQSGRSAFIRAAVQHYLREKERRAIDDAIRRGYGSHDAEMAAEVQDLMESQAWPSE